MFRDADPIEDEMGVRVEYMNPAQLQEYIQMFHRAYGLTLVSRKFSGDQIFGDLQATYGRRDAGRIVKWAFYMGGPHRGRRTDGTPITFSSFAPGCRWLTDVWHLEAQQRIAQEKTASAGASYGGFATLADL